MMAGKSDLNPSSSAKSMVAEQSDLNPSAAIKLFMVRKSGLNPYAAPYVPLSGQFSGVSLGGENKVTNETINEFEIHVPKKGDTSGKSFCEMAEHTEAAGTDNYDAMDDDGTRMIESLAAMFPDIGKESLADVFFMNHCDLEDTVFMLKQIEGDDSLEHGDLPETLDANDYLDPYDLTL